jgi:hypothetical protein
MSSFIYAEIFARDLNGERRAVSQTSATVSEHCASKVAQKQREQ